MCRHKDNADTRAEWGCDKATDVPQLVIPCVRCAGYDPECKICEGTDREEIHDCPNRLIHDELGRFDASVLQMVSLFAHYPESLPRAGGLYDQAAQFVDAMNVVGETRARIEKTRSNAQRSRHQHPRP